MLIFKKILPERLHRKTIEVGLVCDVPSKPPVVMKQAAMPIESEHFRDFMPLVIWLP